MVRQKSIQSHEKLVTREELIRAINLYHALHHTPFYTRWWKRLKKAFAK